MIEQAVVLAGGFGARLGRLTATTPKPLLPVGGRPFLEWLFGELARQGIREVLVLAGFEGEKFRPLVSRWPGADFIVEPTPLGTGGALRFALDRLQPKFFVLNGDSFFDINLLDLSRAEGGVATLALRSVDDGSRYGSVTLQGGVVTRFSDRPDGDGPGLINGGVGVISRLVVEQMEPDCPTSIEKEIYPSLAARGLLRGRVYERPFIDIGVPSDFERAQELIPALTSRRGVILDIDQIVSRSPGGDRQGAAAHLKIEGVRAVKLLNDCGVDAYASSADLWRQLGVGGADLDRNAVRQELIARGARLASFVSADVRTPVGNDGRALAGDILPLSFLNSHHPKQFDREALIVVGAERLVRDAEASGVEGVVCGEADLVHALMGVLREPTS